MNDNVKPMRELTIREQAQQEVNKELAEKSLKDMKRKLLELLLFLLYRVNQ